MSELENEAFNDVLGDLFEGGFEAVEETEALEAESETPDLTADAFYTQDASGNLHAPDGKFVSPTTLHSEEKQKQEEQEPAEEETEEVPFTKEDAEKIAAQADELEGSDEVVIETDDEAILALIEKYDGDVLAALKGATEAQSTIGRQGNELAELRRLAETVEQMRDQMNRPQFHGYTQNVDDNPAGLVQEVLQRAAITGEFDEQTYETAIQAWGEEDPLSAARLDARVAMAREVADQAVAAPQEEASSFESEMQALKAKYPDIATHLPAIQEMAAERPLMAQALQPGGDPRTRAQALEDLYMLARSRDSGSSASAKRIILRAAAEADKAVRDAAVESASNTSAATAGPSEDDALQQAVRAATGLDDLVVV